MTRCSIPFVSYIAYSRTMLGCEIIAWRSNSSRNCCSRVFCARRGMLERQEGEHTLAWIAPSL